MTDTIESTEEFWIRRNKIQAVRIKELEVELKSCEEELLKGTDSMNDMCVVFDKLENQVSKLKEALEFYANKSNWINNGMDTHNRVFSPEEDSDDKYISGKVARTALKKAFGDGDE